MGRSQPFRRAAARLAREAALAPRAPDERAMPAYAGAGDVAAQCECLGRRSGGDAAAAPAHAVALAEQFLGYVVGEHDAEVAVDDDDARAGHGNSTGGWSCRTRVAFWMRMGCRQMAAMSIDAARGRAQRPRWCFRSRCHAPSRPRRSPDIMTAHAVRAITMLARLSGGSSLWTNGHCRFTVF
jgi:hypothetical protein